MVGKRPRQKRKKSVSNKKLLKLQNYQNGLEETQLQNKINHLEKNKIDIFKKDHKGFIRNNELILKTQQRFKGKWHNVFTEEISKTDLSSNDDKIMQSTDSIETYVYGTSKNLVSKKEKIKWNNIMKQCRK